MIPCRPALWIGLLISLVLPHITSAGIDTTARLYSQPDPDAPGGLSGTAAFSTSPLRGAFAMSRADPAKVYAARIEDGAHFTFSGLPVGRYDLLLLYDDSFHEGLQLSRSDTLTERDRQLIIDHIDRTGPFFETKEYHRMAGQTGVGNEARVVFQEYHQREESEIRSLKLGILMQVGAVGWQMVRSREFVRTDVLNSTSQSGILSHHYHSDLGGFRVVDSVREIGTLQ